MGKFKGILFLVLSFGFLHSAFADIPENSQRESSVTVVKVDPIAIERFTHVMNLTFQDEGTSAVVDRLESMSMNPPDLEFLRALRASGEEIKIQQEVHPTEHAAIQWINRRLDRMGLSNVKYNPVFRTDLPDPQEPPPEKIKKWKWFRYLAGPGVAIAATLLKMSQTTTTATSSSDYLVMLIPAGAVGVASIILEYNFANPWMNSKVWAPVFGFGGPVVGRAVITAVNVTYGMILWGASYAATATAIHKFGVDPSLVQIDPFMTALAASTIGGGLFTLAMGQYQTDLAVENQKRESISSFGRYRSESIGVGINNGARVGGWAVGNGGMWTNVAYLSFFLWKTWPQLLKTNLDPKLQDLDLQRRLNPESPAKRTFGESCMRIARAMTLFKLPKLRKT